MRLATVPSTREGADAAQVRPPTTAATEPLPGRTRLPVRSDPGRPADGSRTGPEPGGGRAWTGPNDPPVGGGHLDQRGLHGRPLQPGDPPRADAELLEQPPDRRRVQPAGHRGEPRPGRPPTGALWHEPDERASRAGSPLRADEPERALAHRPQGPLLPADGDRRATDLPLRRPRRRLQPLPPRHPGRPEPGGAPDPRSPHGGHRPVRRPP